MVRHISLFRLKDACRTPETLRLIRGLLRALPEQVPTILTCEVGSTLSPELGESPDGAVQFGDLVQILTFASREDCDGYPATEGHRAFLEATHIHMEQVTAIDYAVEE